MGTIVISLKSSAFSVHFLLLVLIGTLGSGSLVASTTHTDSLISQQLPLLFEQNQGLFHRAGTAAGD
jgi:hypothetical protein